MTVTTTLIEKITQNSTILFKILNIFTKLLTVV